MDKSCPGKEGHPPPSRINFSERLYEEKVDTFAGVYSWLSNDNNVRACSYRLALTTRLGEPKCLYGEKLAQLGGSPFKPSQLFVSHENGSSSFVRKCPKSWLAQGSSNRKVTLFLHILERGLMSSILSSILILFLSCG